MNSTITSKFQTTIPKKIREKLHLSIADTLRWEIKNGDILVKPEKKAFLSFRNSIRVGRGRVKKDIFLVRKKFGCVEG